MNSDSKQTERDASLLRDSPRRSHPTVLQLERSSFGEGDIDVASHIATCQRCQEFMRVLEAERLALLEAAPAMDFVRKLQARERTVLGRPWPLAFLAPIVGGAVVGLLLTVGGSSSPSDLTRESSSATWEEQETALEGAKALVPKGASSATLILERRGRQTTVQGDVRIEPGDRLRVILRVTGEELYAAGVLTDAGQWLPFFEGKLARGTHMPDTTLRVDETPMSGALLFGAAEDVMSARAALQSKGVQRMRLEWQVAE